MKKQLHKHLIQIFALCFRRFFSDCLMYRKKTRISYMYKYNDRDKHKRNHNEQKENNDNSNTFVSMGLIDFNFLH